MAIENELEDLTTILTEVKQLNNESRKDADRADVKVAKINERLTFLKGVGGDIQPIKNVSKVKLQKSKISQELVISDKNNDATAGKRETNKNFTIKE